MYKFFVCSTFTIGIIASIAFYFVSIDQKPNYLYMGVTDLEQHAVSVPHDNRKVAFFLGSSSVLGSNVPKNTTVVDYFNEFMPTLHAYNLATQQSNLLETLAIFVTALEYKKPEVVILGVNPSSFANTLATGYINDNLDSLVPYLESATLRNLKSDLSKKVGLGNKFFNKKLPLFYQIEYRTYIEKLSYLLYGNVYNKMLFGHSRQYMPLFSIEHHTVKALHKIHQICIENNIEFHVYLEPILMPNVAYGEDAFINYLETIKSILSASEINFYDYTNSVASNHDNFIDFIHMRPQAYKLVANLLYTDLRGKLD